MCESSAQSEQTTPLGRRARKAIASREAMFAAGLAAFDRQPIGLVSVLDITEAADIAKGVFYLHFNSKDDYLLALLDNVQKQFLNHVELAVEGLRSQRSRIAMVLREHHRFMTAESAAARFRIRMSSYFNDEVSGPGQLATMRREYIERLAAIIYAKGSRSKIVARDVRAAATLDALCWSVSLAHSHYGVPILDDAMMSRLVNCVVRSATDPVG